MQDWEWIKLYLIRIIAQWYKRRFEKWFFRNIFNKNNKFLLQLFHFYWFILSSNLFTTTNTIVHLIKLLFFCKSNILLKLLRLYYHVFIAPFFLFNLNLIHHHYFDVSYIWLNCLLNFRMCLQNRIYFNLTCIIIIMTLFTQTKKDIQYNIETEYCLLANTAVTI